MTLARGGGGARVRMELSPKQVASLEKMYSRPGRPGWHSKMIAPMLKPYCTVTEEQVQEWFEARRAREEEVSGNVVPVKKAKKKKVRVKVEEVNVKEVKVEGIKVEEVMVEDGKLEEVKVEEKTLEDVKVEEVKVEEMEVEEVVAEELVVEKVARSNSYTLRHSSTPTPSSLSPSNNFWRPWEASCEATAVRKWSGEATTLFPHNPAPTLLRSVVTPPALVTPQREEVWDTGRKVGRRLRRLLTFQATLEKEWGLPPSRWQQKLEFGEEGEATLLNTPVSRRRRGRRRGQEGNAEASSPKLRRGSMEEGLRCTTSPQSPGYGELEASRHAQTLLHSSLSPGGWDGGGHRGFCFGCQSWGNMVLLG